MHRFFSSIRDLLKGSQKKREKSDNDEESERQISDSFFGRETDRTWPARANTNLKVSNDEAQAPARAGKGGPERAGQSQKSKGAHGSKRERAETETETEETTASERDQRSVRQMGEQSVSRWIARPTTRLSLGMTDEHSRGQGDDRISSKSKGTIKEAEFKTRGNAEDGMRLFSGDSPDYRQALNNYLQHIYRRRDLSWVRNQTGSQNNPQWEAIAFSEFIIYMTAGAFLIPLSD